MRGLNIRERGSMRQFSALSIDGGFLKCGGEPPPEPMTVTASEFQRNPGAVTSRAERLGPVTITNDAGEPRMQIHCPRDPRPYDTEEIPEARRARWEAALERNAIDTRPNMTLEEYDARRRLEQHEGGPIIAELSPEDARDVSDAAMAVAMKQLAESE